MTAFALSAPSSLDLSSSTFPSITAIAETVALGTLDTAGRVIQTVEQGVDAAAQALSVAVPAVTRFIGGFVLPEHVNRILGTVIEYGAAGVSGIVAGGAKATVQTMSFGAPAWIETLRNGAGVSAVADHLNQGETSREFLARCFAENTAEPLIKESLLSYLNLRKDLNTLQQQPEIDQGKLTQVSRDIARLEIKLRDYQDFSSLKLVLEKGDEFVAEQHKRINQLAHDTAGNIVERVEQYYQGKCGEYAGKIKGSWSAADTDEKRTALRTALTEKIALRLQGVFDREMSADETVAQLNAVTGELHSAFGTYRSAFKATLGTILGVGYATGAFQYLAQAAGSAIVGWAQDGVISAAQSLKESVHSGLKSCYDYFYGVVADSINQMIESNPVIASIKQGAEAVSDTGDRIRNAVVNSIENLKALIPNTNHYSSPKPKGVFIGIGPDGPMYGESCTSGYRPQPSISAGMSDNDFDSLRAALRTPRQDLKLNSDKTAKLLEFLRQ